MKLFNVIVGSLASSIVGATIFAQQPTQTPTNQGQPRQTQPTANQPSAHHSSGAMHLSNDVFAACLAIENQEEIQIAQFAKDKTKDKEVKDFATMLIDEHNAMLSSLRRVAPNSAQVSSLKGSTPYDKNTSNDPTQQNRNASENRNPNAPSSNTAASNTNENRNQTTPFTTASSQSQVSSGSMVDPIQLQREFAEQCLSDTKEKLSQKSDKEFDKCFVGMQVAKHAAMQTKLTVLQRHATGELKNVIGQGLETTKKHLKHAESLMAKLDENDASKSKQKTE